MEQQNFLRVLARQVTWTTDDVRAAHDLRRSGHMGNGDQSTAVQAPGIRSTEHNGRTYDIELATETGEWLVFTTDAAKTEQVGRITPDGMCLGNGGFRNRVSDVDVWRIAELARVPVEGLFPLAMAERRPTGDA